MRERALVVPLIPAWLRRGSLRVNGLSGWVANSMSMAHACSHAGRRHESGERPREAQLVAVRIVDVEVAFAPFSIAWLRVGMQLGLESPAVHLIYVRDVEDDSAPPQPPDSTG